MYIQVLWLYKVHNHQVAGEKVTNDQNFHFFVSDHLNRTFLEQQKTFTLISLMNSKL